MLYLTGEKGLESKAVLCCGCFASQVWQTPLELADVDLLAKGVIALTAAAYFLAFRLSTMKVEAHAGENDPIV